MVHHNLINQAKELIAIPSTADNQPALHQAVDYIANIIAAHKGITIERFQDNGVPSLLAYPGTTRPKKFDILFNAHVDVVPGRPQDYNMRIEDGKMYGRGTYDMKLAALIMTNTFCQNATRAKKRIGLQIVADEEVGGYNGVYHQLAQGIPPADLVIAGEMTNLEICNETRGICWAEVTFSGKNAHGGYVWYGDNAIVKASDFVSKLAKAIPTPTVKTWATTANVASISTTNDIYNAVPDSAIVRIDFRFTPSDDRFKTQQGVVDLIKSMAHQDHTTVIKILSPGVAVPPDHPELTNLMTAYEQTTGKKAQLIKRYASSDARHFAEHNQHCVEFGLSGDGMHGDTEHVTLDSVEPFADTLKTLINL